MWQSTRGELAEFITIPDPLIFQCRLHQWGYMLRIAGWFGVTLQLQWVLVPPASSPAQPPAWMWKGARYTGAERDHCLTEVWVTTLQKVKLHEITLVQRATPLVYQWIRQLSLRLGSDVRGVGVVSGYLWKAALLLKWDQGIWLLRSSR